MRNTFIRMEEALQSCYNTEMKRDVYSDETTSNSNTPQNVPVVSTYESVEIESDSYSGMGSSGSARGRCCPICLSTYDILFTLSTCGCSFCRQCLEVYITTAMNSCIDYNFSCPNYSCSSTNKLSESNIRSIVPVDVYQRYLLLKCQRDIEKDPTLTYCPRTSCSAVCRISSLRAPNSFSASWSCDPSGGLQPGRHLLVRFYRLLASKVNRTTLKRLFAKVFSSADQSTHCSCFLAPNSQTPTIGRPSVPVVCPKCGHKFCARCHNVWYTDAPTPYRRRTGEQQQMVSNLQSTTYLQRQISIFKSQLAFLPKLLLSSSKNCQLLNYVFCKATIKCKKKLFPQSRQSSLSLPESGWLCLRTSHSSVPFQNEENTLVTETKVHLQSEPGNGTPDNRSSLVAMETPIGLPPFAPDAQFKRCPFCFVPVERVDGCAQMCCGFCDRTFCWYCLTSLDADLLLHHFDSGACRGKLGHSKVSLSCYRLYIVTLIAATIVFVTMGGLLIWLFFLGIACAYSLRMMWLQYRRKTQLLGSVPGVSTTVFVEYPPPLTNATGERYISQDLEAHVNMQA